jgi:hypothetical protein
MMEVMILAQSTAFENLGTDLISDNDSNVSGILTLYSIQVQQRMLNII